MDYQPIKDCRVCVVGGAGFLGSHVTEELQSRGCSVWVLDDLSVGRREFVPSGVTLLKQSITTTEDLTDLFRGTDFVFNYAAMPFIPDCYLTPVQALAVNTLGALQVLEWCTKAEVKRILQVSSAEVYGNTQQNSSSISPISTYATSKAAIDLIAQARYVEVGTPVVILRQFNCVGERETHPYVIPEIIEQVFKNREDSSKSTLTIDLGEDTNRDFLYAGDAACMAIELLEKGALAQAYDMGSQETVSIYQLARIISSIIEPGRQLEIVKDPNRCRPLDIWSLKADNQKLYTKIDYRPQVSLVEALDKTITYYEQSDYRWGF